MAGSRLLGDVIAKRRRGPEPGGDADAIGSVEPTQIREQHGRGPTVAHYMVHGEHEAVALDGLAHREGTNQWPLGEVEGRLALSFEQRFDLTRLRRPITL